MALVEVPLTLSELTGPGPAISAVTPEDADLTRNAGTGGEAIGQRIIVTGRVLDDRGNPRRTRWSRSGRPTPPGRYIHERDQWPGPLDPNFLGIGRCLTDDEGIYRFLTVMPGVYPWKNHHNAWRPAHIHFSLFGSSLASRLVTQMYFPDDPLLSLDPIFSAIPNDRRAPADDRAYAHDVTEPEWALGYRWDIVLRRSGGDAVRGDAPGAARSGTMSARRSRLDDDLADGRAVLPRLALLRDAANNVLVGAETTRRAHPDRGTRHRRRRRRRPGRDGRDLAGERARPLQPPARPAGPAARSRTFTGFGRVRDRRRTDASGSTTIKPGPVPFDDTRAGAAPQRARLRARHAQPPVTRLYFDDEPANAADPILAPGARAPAGDPAGRARRVQRYVVYRLDIVLQGGARRSSSTSNTRHRDPVILV